jgi:hypothetical protein
LIQTNRGIGYTFTCISAVAPSATGRGDKCTAAS